MDLFSSLSKHLLSLFVSGLPLVLAITLHEAAHGYASLRCGDDTALRMGRLTLNPLKHVDLVGTILLPLGLILLHVPFLFGYAKPVPVNFSRLKNPRRDMAWVALAGPGMNLFLAFLSLIALAVLKTGHNLDPFSQIFGAMLEASLSVNIFLAVLNMVPIPPLDGGRVAVGLLPPSLSRPLERLEPHGFFILTSLMFLPDILGIEHNPFMQFLQYVAFYVQGFLVKLIF